MTLTPNEKEQTKKAIEQILNFFKPYQKDLREVVRISFRSYKGRTVELMISNNEIYGYTGQTRLTFTEGAEKRRGYYVLDGGYWISSYALGIVQQWQTIKTDFLREYKKQADSFNTL